MIADLSHEMETLVLLLFLRNSVTEGITFIIACFSFLIQGSFQLHAVRHGQELADYLKITNLVQYVPIYNTL